MRRFVVLLLGLLLTVTVSQQAWAQVRTFAPGDANGDGLLTLADIQAIVDQILGRAQAPGDPDCNQDGGVDVGDILCLTGTTATIPPDPSDLAPPTPAGITTTPWPDVSFLYDGQDPIQVGVVPGTIDPHRVAVLRGVVRDQGGAPLPGALVRVLGRPQFGYTFSRSDGAYDLAVNGGGFVTVEFRRLGYLPLQRKITTTWNEFLHVEDAVLTPLDSVVTSVDLSDGQSHTVRGSTVTDDSGSRTGTLVIPAGTTAEFVMPDGSTQSASALTLRITEVTVGETGPKAMPAPLPGNVAYTYCVAITADEALMSGAAGIRFDQGIPYYVENFLGMSVGGRVPVGALDGADASWLPQPDGRVVKILSTAGGVAELDVDGSGSPADAVTLGAMGITEDELTQLASLYSTGQELWRVVLGETARGTKEALGGGWWWWDFNWPFGFPAGAEAPPNSPPEREPDTADPCTECGSVIEVQNQALGEIEPLVGVPFSLVYNSMRVRGRKTSRQVTIPLSGETLPTPLKAIELQLAIAGQYQSLRFSPLPNQSYSFVWDGLDAYGRQVMGRRMLTVRVGYIYDGVYLDPSEAPGAEYDALFGHFSYYGTPATANPVRREVALWRTFTLMLGSFPNEPLGFGGWSPNILHVYDPVEHTLYRGDGRRERASATELKITTAGYAAGTQPQGLAVDDDGTIAVSCYDGGVSTFNPYQQVPLSSFGAGGQHPHGVAFGPDNALYVAAPFEGRIDRVDRETGRVTTALSVGGPVSVAFDNEGRMIVGALWPGRIYREEPDGTLTVVAGGGAASPGDGLPGPDVNVGNPYDVWPADDGSIYYIEPGEHRVKVITPEGLVKTVAGTGEAGHSGDGGQALQATFGTLASVTMAPDGSLLVTEHEGLVRRIGPDGIVRTIAGTLGGGGSEEDGAPAVGADTGGPRHVRVGPDGYYYLDAFSDGTVKRIFPASASLSMGELMVASDNGQDLYIFDWQGRHLRTLDAGSLAVKYQFSYDQDGRVVAVTDTHGNVTMIERDEATGLATAIMGPDGQRTEFTYDSFGYLASISNPAGETVHYHSTADGLLSSRTDVRGAVTTMIWDTDGRLRDELDAAGGAKHLTRAGSSSAYQVTVTTATGKAKVYSVEFLADGVERRVVGDPACSCGASETVRTADGSLTRTAADGTVTQSHHAGDPRFGTWPGLTDLETVTTPSGLEFIRTATRQVDLVTPGDPSSMRNQYDITTVNGRTYTSILIAAAPAPGAIDITPEGREVSTDLDEYGRPSVEHPPGLEPVSYTYDARGRLATVTQGARTWTLSYDGDGNLASIMDPLGRATSFAYDAAGRVTTQTLPDGRQIQFAYDANGNVTAITPPGRPAHAFSYTPVDQQASYTPPDVGIGPTATTYSYTLDRQLAQITRPDGRAVGFAYDGSGRLATITFDRGDIAFTYDPATGQLTNLTAPGGEGLSFTHDGFLQTGTTWSGTINGSVTRTYDNNFWVTSTSINGGHTASFAYDDDGLLTQAGDLAITRDAQNGLITGTTLDTLSDAWTYNAYGEPSSYTASDASGDLYAVTYTRDDLGRITKKAETIAGDQMTWDYAYDTAGRLVSSTLTTPSGSWTTTYTYDANGNRLERTGPGGTETGTYDDQDRMLSYGPCTYTYTANGEVTTTTCGSEITSYTYDDFGNLTHVVMPDGITIDYVIDARNRRVGKKVNGTLVQGFLYGDQLNPVAELDGSGAVVARFVYGTKPNVPDYMLKGGTTYRYITDQLGSVRLVVDAATGAIAQRIDYDEYGVTIQDTNPGFQPFGFAGGVVDSHTGLVRFGARDYDPTSGRWTSKEILGLGGGIDLYVYSGCSPVDLADPSGLQLVVFPPGPPIAVPPCCTAGPWIPGDYSTSLKEKRGDWKLDKSIFLKAPLPVALPDNLTPALPLPMCFCQWMLTGQIEVYERLWTYSRNVTCSCRASFVQVGRVSREFTKRLPILYDPNRPITTRTPGVPNYALGSCVGCAQPH